MIPISRRTCLISGAATLAAASLPDFALADRRIVLNDASRLNPTPVLRHWIVDTDADEAFIARLETAYPDLPRFLERKRHYNPGLLFRNLMWNAYFA